MEITELLLAVIGTIIFLMPGTFLGFILFPKSDIVQRSVFSLALSVGCLGILSVVLYAANAFEKGIFTLTSILMSGLFLGAAIALKKRGKIIWETKYEKSALFILFFSAAGALWRYFYIKSIPNFNNPYEFSFKLIGREIPDLGYFTGMARDKSSYAGNLATDKIAGFLNIQNDFLLTFLSVFLLLGLVFLVFRNYGRSNRMAYLGVVLMSAGPVEIFYSRGLYGHSLIYSLALILFLFFKSENMKIFWIALIISLAMMTTYYTSLIVIILCCFSFAAVLAIKSLAGPRSIRENVAGLIKNKKLLSFLAIFFLAILYLVFFTNMFSFTVGRAADSGDIKTAADKLNYFLSGSAEDTFYKDPSFFGLSAIRWQMLFFSLCSVLFFARIISKKGFLKRETDLFLSLMPAAVVSGGFVYLNMAARPFGYFAFLFLLLLGEPRRYFKTIFAVLTISVFLTTWQTAKDKKVFLSISDAEISGAVATKELPEGRIFSDIVFANRMILSGNYNVTGADDKSDMVRNLFYQRNEGSFLNEINGLKKIKKADYIAITRRMTEKYVLMTNYPQKPIFTQDFFEENLEKVYDNGEVKIYKTSI